MARSLEDYLTEQADLSDSNTPEPNTSQGNDDGNVVDQSADHGTIENNVEDVQPQQQEQQPANNQQAQPQDGQQQQQTQQAQPNNGRQAYTIRGVADEQGNIVDEQGNMLIPRGGPRRIFEENRRLTSKLTQIERVANDLNSRLQQTQFLNGVPQQYGMSNEEVASALDLGARLKRGDVLGVAKDVVAMLAAKGHNITELFGQEVGDSVDMRAIRRMVDDATAPLRQQEQQVQQQQAANNAAYRQYEEFVTNNEYSDVQGDIIVAMQKAQGISLQQAYNEVRHFAAVNGLDMSQPLGPQIDARMAARQQQQQRQPSAQPAPMLSGDRGGRANNGVQTIAPAFMDADASWTDIIRDAMGRG